jgi:hypothetical protein
MRNCFIYVTFARNVFIEQGGHLRPIDELLVGKWEIVKLALTALGAKAELKTPPVFWVPRWSG